VVEAVNYDPETGVFSRAGERAGSVMSHGYREISVLGQRFTEHRLAWFYVNGVWPDKFLDHINGDKSDNRICNLREATPSQNAMNQKNKPSASGVRGVYFICGNRPKPWNARIKLNYRTKSLGYYSTKEEAALVYESAAKKLFGPFYRPSDFTCMAEISNA